MNEDPMGAPPGVTLRFLPRPSGSAWASWLLAHPRGTYWESRQVIQPRLLLVHTNAASGEGTEESAYNWSMAKPDNAKPHYQVDRDGSATKFLPSNRRGVCNASFGSDPRTGGKNVATWSLAIETADLGFGVGKPGGAIGFTPEQGEMVAQIIAYEARLWGFPIEYPTTWDGDGVACHTEPFEFPYWTIYKGKTCPGERKKIEMQSWILPRVREINIPIPQPPTPQPPSEEDDMKYIFVAKAGTPEQYLWIPGTGAPIPFASPADRDLILGQLGLLDGNGNPKPGITVSVQQFASLR